MFNIKIESKILKALEYFGDYAVNPIDKSDGRVYFPDKARVALIEAISEDARHVIMRFIEKDQEDKLEYPENVLHEYEDKAVTFEFGGKYSSEYLEKIFKLLGIANETIKIYSKKDFPLIAENRDFRIILAPRVDTD